jgi:hypothetical protein
MGQVVRAAQQELLAGAHGEATVGAGDDAAHPGPDVDGGVLTTGQVGEVDALPGDVSPDELLASLVPYGALGRARVGI